MSVDRIIRRPELLRITGLSAATIYRKISQGWFPRPVQLGKNSIGWKASSIQAWLDSLEEAGIRTPPGADGKQPASGDTKLSRQNGGTECDGLM